MWCRRTGPALYSQLNYDAGTDLASIARLASLHNVLIVHPSVPARTLKQFISRARANPGKLNSGSGGAGIDPWPGTAEELTSLVRSEAARYAGIIKSIGLRLD